MEKPSFAQVDGSVRFPYDELYDAVETGTSSGSNLLMSLTGFAQLRSEASLRHAWDRALPIGRFLRSRLRFFGWVVSAAIPLSAGIVGLFAVGLAVGRWTAPARQVAPSSNAPLRPSGSSSALPAASSVAASMSPAEPGLGTRAAQGDLLAVAAIETKPAAERTAEEVLALRSGRVAREREALADLSASLAKEPERGLDSLALGHIDAALDDPRYLGDALTVLAHMPAGIGPDLLYEALHDDSRSVEVRTLAGELLAAKDVGARATPTLRAVLAMTNAEGCRAIASALHDVEVHADARSLPSLWAASITDPCTVGASEECAACQAATERLSDIMAAVGERAYTVRLARTPSWARSVSTEESVPPSASASTAHPIRVGGAPAASGASAPSAARTVASPRATSSAPPVVPPRLVTDPGF
ncbi:MAG: hypothetical protein JW751_06335 [Polyangiaceae bacterium]|nr:hypothetical protein [Polyangiaceae bacterium]